MMRGAALLCLVSLVWGQELPSPFQKCPVSTERDNKPNECLRGAISSALAGLANGEPTLGVGSVDPLEVKKVIIDQGEKSPVAVKLTFTNCVFTGIKDLTLDSVTGKMSSPSGFVMKATGSIPRLALTGPYSIGGRVLILPIQGKGQSNLTMDGMKVVFTLKGEQKMKDGVRYLKVTDFKVNFKHCSRLWVYLENLFNGDKALGDNMNTFLNANWADIWNELRPGVNAGASKVLMEYTKMVIEQIPFDQIFSTSQ